MEVCVSDNGSRDRTVDVVESARLRLGSRLVYRRHQTDLGFTRNLLSAVELASGTYCWLFSSDDTVAVGALDELGGFLARHDDLSGLTLRPGALGRDLAPRAEVLPLLAFPRERETTHLYDSAESALTECGFLTGLLAAQIVRRDLWSSIVTDVRDELVSQAHYFPHMNIIFRMIIATPRWGWHPGRLFHLQTENANSVLDSLGGDLLAYRLNIVRELDYMWAGLLGRRSRVYRGLMARAHGFEFGWRPLLVIKAAPGRGRRDDGELLRVLVSYFWWLPAFWIRSFPSLLVPSRAARVARSARLTLLALRTRAFKWDG